jgi:hypothetical protein
MARTKVKLKELRDAEIRFVSLVDRAASRIPFRVVKRDQESDMIDLTKPGLVMRVLKSAGIVKTGETNMDNAQKAGAGVISIESLMSKAPSGYKGGDDAWNMLSTADKMAWTQAWWNGSSNIPKVAADPAAAVPAVATLTKPASVDQAAWDAMTPAQQATAVEDAADGGADDATEVAKAELTIKVPMSDAEKAHFKDKCAAKDKLDFIKGDSAARAKMMGGSDTAAKEEAEKALAAKTEADALKATLTAISTTLEALTKSTQENGTQLQALATKVETSNTETAKRIDEIARKSDTALTAVNSVVTGGKPAGDDPAGKEVAVKEDTDPRTGSFDTAYIRIAQKREKRTAR